MIAEDFDEDHTDVYNLKTDKVKEIFFTKPVTVFNLNQNSFFLQFHIF